MRDQNAQKLLAKVMGWEQEEIVQQYVPTLQLLSNYKYDHYQQFAPGKRFIESLALWLKQFDLSDRQEAIDFVMNRLIFISDSEFSHLVQIAYPDLIVQERIRLVAEEQDIPLHRIGAITQHSRFDELRQKSLYLGLSDGARTNELRRASNGEISNEQIWQAYELSDEKAEDMLSELRKNLGPSSKFNLIWLLDDFSASGNSYIRYDNKQEKYKGKIKKIYDKLHDDTLVDTTHYEVFLLLYVATRQAIDHIEYWSERFTSEYGYKPLQIKVLCTIDYNEAVFPGCSPQLESILNNPKYYDEKASDSHIKVGGTEHARLGFANCALPVVLSHNTPNNSVYLLWGPDSYKFVGLFPRVIRHREF